MNETKTPTVRSNDAQAQRAVLPAVDVFEDATGITLLADMPGVPRDRLDVKVEADTLSIEGEVVAQTPEGLEAVYAEVRVRLLGDAQRQHAVLQVGLDLRRIEFAAQRERAAVARHAHLGVHRFQAVGRLRRDLAFDQQRVGFDLHVEPILRHAGHVGQQRDAGPVFEHIDRGQHGALLFLLGAGAGHLLVVAHVGFSLRVVRVTAR